MKSMFFEPKINLDKISPLADRIRPKTLVQFVGQEHILGKGKPLRKAIEKGQVSSIILWGPPGSGKTTLARIIAYYTKAAFVEFSAVNSGVKEVRQTIKEAKDRLNQNRRRTILFIDEIHRFNKAQQDAFLPHVENGTIILVGATTENPGFEINAPLISRSQIYELRTLADQDIRVILKRGLREFPKCQIDKSAFDYFVQSSKGDARIGLNALELACHTARKITLKIAEEAVGKKAIYYDKKGDWHYDIISAFIKSVRGSDADAALYWLARMIQAGEDPVFIARRLVILASEDIGNAQPTALVLATSGMQAVHLVGMPEAGIILAQVTVYLAKAKKSNASYQGLLSSLIDAQKTSSEPVPIHLRNAVTKFEKQLSFGKDYKYPHNYQGSKVEQEYLPKKLKGKKYYQNNK